MPVTKSKKVPAKKTVAKKPVAKNIVSKPVKKKTVKTAPKKAAKETVHPTNILVGEAYISGCDLIIPLNMAGGEWLGGRTLIIREVLKSCTTKPKATKK